MQQDIQAFFAQAIKRPLSLLGGLLAVSIIVFSLYQRSKGILFLESLNYIDATTPVLIGILLMRGLIRMRSDTDLQAVSIALIGSLSFVFAFEAIYKLSFYILPIFMPPDELREFVIQVGVSLTVLAGFAFGKFYFSKASKIFLAVFAAEWAFWLLIGFPQIFTEQLFYPAIINVHLEWGMIYLLNRVAKFSMFLVYFYFYSNKEI